VHVGAHFCLTFNGNNQVSGGLLTHFAHGNVTADNMHHYTYDEESRITQVNNGGTGGCLRRVGGVGLLSMQKMKQLAVEHYRFYQYGEESLCPDGLKD
jgi:hypothetical protein